MQIYNATLNTIRGLAHGVRNERALRQEAIVFAVAVPAGAFLAPGIGWYVAMIGTLLVTMAVELLNTAIEKLCDRITLDFDPRIGMVKDLGSAAVFFTICLSVLIWLAAVVVRFGSL